MVQGSWVRVPLPVSFFLLFFLFSFCSSSPMSAPVARVGVGGFILSASIPFSFFLPVSVSPIIYSESRPSTFILFSSFYSSFSLFLLLFIPNFDLQHPLSFSPLLSLLLSFSTFLLHPYSQIFYIKQLQFCSILS